MFAVEHDCYLRGSGWRSFGPRVGTGPAGPLKTFKRVSILTLPSTIKAIEAGTGRGRIRARCVGQRQRSDSQESGELYGQEAEDGKGAGKFSDAEHARKILFGVDRPCGAGTGANLWMLDDGLSGMEQEDWADDIKPAVRRRTHAQNGVCVRRRRRTSPSR